MYASVVHFENFNEESGIVVSDGRPLKGARKYQLGDKIVVLRVFEADNGLLLRVTRNVLGGEVLFEGEVSDGQHMRIEDELGSFWVVAISRDRIDVDPTDHGSWIDSYGRLRVYKYRGDYEGWPEEDFEDLIPAPDRTTPAFREATEISGADIRFLAINDGGFFEGESNIEVWRVPDEDCFKVRFWHDRGDSLPKRKTQQIKLPEKVSYEEMDSLITKLLSLGLAETYSFYCNRGVLDGGGWSLLIGTMDGYEWRWAGYNAYPRGWNEARDAICELLLGYPSHTPYVGHTAYVADWHDADGDRGRTEIAHLYRHMADLDETIGYSIPSICANIRQDVLLYRRTRRHGFECQALDSNQYMQILADAVAGKAHMHTVGELMGAVVYIVEHDNAEQDNMKKLVCDGTMQELLCNARVRDKAAPGLAISGWEV